MVVLKEKEVYEDYDLYFSYSDTLFGFSILESY